jgi:hypothetical protein
MLGFNGYIPSNLGFSKKLLKCFHKGKIQKLAHDINAVLSSHVEYVVRMEMVILTKYPENKFYIFLNYA